MNAEGPLRGLPSPRTELAAFLWASSAPWPFAKSPQQVANEAIDYCEAKGIQVEHWELRHAPAGAWLRVGPARSVPVSHTNV